MKHAAAAVPDDNDHEMRGRKPTTVDWIYMRDIDVDSRYQRPLDQNRVARLVANFDPDALGIPFVVEIRLPGSAKRYFAIDGQHRIKAAMEFFGADQMIQCEIIKGISVPRAAKLYDERNTQRQPRALDRFLALLTANDAETVAINDIVTSVGLRVDRNRTDNVVQSVVVLRKVYRGDRAVGPGKNPLPLKRTLLICKEAWGPTPDAYQGEIIEGIGRFLTRYGERVDSVELTRKLKAYPGGALKFLGEARGYRGLMRGSVAHAVSLLVTQTYNKGRRNKALPEWRRSTETETEVKRQKRGKGRTD